jgi:hypothetical protein
MGSAALAEAAKSIREWSLTNRISTSPATRAADVYGSLVFHDKLQRERLPKTVYRALRATVTRGEPLDAATADAVAVALKDWASEQGATHYTHWFQPMTGITAEKARLVPGPGRRRHRDRRVQRQGAGARRAGRLELPVRRHALHLRGARLYGVGPHEQPVAARQRQQRHAGHSHRVRELDR